MVVASFVIILTLGILNVINLGNDDAPPGPRLFSFVVGVALIVFSVVGLVHNG